MYGINSTNHSLSIYGQKRYFRIYTTGRTRGGLNPYLDALTGTSWGNFEHDFWLTRSGRGAGFWDRGEIGDGVGKKITDIFISTLRRYFPYLKVMEKHTLNIGLR